MQQSNAVKTKGLAFIELIYSDETQDQYTYTGYIRALKNYLKKCGVDRIAESSNKVIAYKGNRRKTYHLAQKKEMWNFLGSHCSIMAVNSSGEILGFVDKGSDLELDFKFMM